MGISRNFSVEASNCGDFWETLDSFTSDMLNQRGTLITFNFKAQNNKYYNYIKLNVHKCSYSSSNWKAISRIAFDGSIKKDSNTCTKNIHIPPELLYILIVH